MFGARRWALVLAAAVGVWGCAWGASARAAAPVFSDVPAGYWAAPAIATMASRGVLRGVGGGRFDPNGLLTRAQFATMLARLAKLPAGEVGPRFTDVTPADWFYRGVESATGQGWMAGVGAGRFAPDATVQRDMAAVAVINDLGLNHVAADEGGAALPFADAAAVPAWAHGSMAAAYHLGLMVGSAGRLDPQAPLTRAQAAELLTRLAAVTPQQLQAEGGRVAAAVHVLPAQSAAVPGQTFTVNAYAHDAAGYVVPARFAWSVSGGSVAPQAGNITRGTAMVTPAAGSGVTVTVTVLGDGATAHLTIPVQQPARLSVSAVPPLVLSRAQLPLQVRVLTAGGHLVRGASPTVTALATPAGGGAPLQASATLRGGQGQLTLPALPVGTYQVRIQTSGLPARTATLRSVAAPVGQLVLMPGPGARASSGGGAPTVAVGATFAVEGTIQPLAAATVAGNWPLAVTASGRQAVLPRLIGEIRPPSVLQVHAVSGILPAAGGPAATFIANAVGSGALRVSVPGGAVLPATLGVQVLAQGQFGTALPAATVTAGQMAQVSVHLLQADGAPATGSTYGVPIFAEPIDPAGHPMPWITATIHGGVATISFQPHQAGHWSFRWYGYEYGPAAAGSLMVTPGAAARLVVDPTPTSVLLPGQQATVQAWIADAYGNPIATPFNLDAGCGGGPAGQLNFRPMGFAGPGGIGTFQATTPGVETCTFSSPDHAALGPASVTFRTVATPADRVAGKGMWLIFPDWRTLGTTRLLAMARAEGVTHIYLEVATTSDGFYGGRGLDSFLARAHAQGIAVISWVYAALQQPAKDTTTLQQVAAYTTPHGSRADGVALDLEQVLTPSIVAAYTAAAHAAVGPQGLVVAVVYPPQYGPPTPFAALAPNVQVVAPMDYWHIYEADYSYSYVYQWVANAVKLVRQRTGVPNMPVEVIAQTFDEFAGGSGKGIFSPTAAELAAAIRAASRSGAVGVSFYRPTTATPSELAVLTDRPWPDG